MRLLAGYPGAKRTHRFWVRNLVRRRNGAFFLQRRMAGFYPDFLYASCPIQACRAPSRRGIQGARTAGWPPKTTAIGGLWAVSEGAVAS